jgi:ATP-dependent Clp protease ATP-binding subunit ClpB
MTSGAAPKKVLDLTKNHAKLDELAAHLKATIVGQDEPCTKLVEIVSAYKSGLHIPGRPLGNALFLGPTGTGKTRVVEALCEGLFHDARACVKIDCAEFQHSHEIAKLIGSPPGYLGHRETHPLLTQEALNQWFNAEFKIGVVLFDEIEKASDSLWQLMLGIMDKATLTLGDNRRVDFSQCIIILTSNLGGKAMSDLLTHNGFGFQQSTATAAESISDDKNHAIALEAAKKHFTPEFMNRIDNVVVFKTLTEDNIRKVLDIEIAQLARRLFDTVQFMVQLTDGAKERILKEGYSAEYGARFLKRVLDAMVRIPLAKLIASDQINAGDYVVIDEVGTEDFEFSIQPLRLSRVQFKDAGDIL